MKEGRNLDKPPACKYQSSQGVLKDLGCFFDAVNFLDLTISGGIKEMVNRLD